jgi:hypothetical protein
MNLIRRIHHSFISGRWTMTFGLVLFLLFRLLWRGEGDWIIFWATALLQMAVGVLLLVFTHKHNVVKNKPLLPAFFFLLLAGSNPAFFYNLQGSVSVLLIAICVILLFNGYHDRDSPQNVLNMAMILFLGSIYWPPLLLFLPLLGYGLYLFKAFSGKTLPAAIIGLGAILLILSAWSAYREDWTIFERLFSDWAAAYRFRFQWPGLQEWIAIGFPLLLLGLSFIRIFISGTAEKMRVVDMVKCLSFLACTAGVLLFLQNQYLSEWLLILYLPLSVLLTHYFTLSNRQGEMWLFLATLAFCPAVYLWAWFR